MNEMTHRTTLQRGGMRGAVVALDTVWPAPARAAPAASSRRFKAIDAALAAGVSRNDVAGVVALAATPSGLVCEGAFGTANAATGAPMTAGTVFWLLSMTKAFTATACMQLIGQGRPQLDDDAAKYLPELAAPQVLEGFAPDGTPRLRPAKRAIKVRHLLTHTSGYTYSIWSEALTRYEQATGMPDIATCRNAAFTAPLEFDPGDRWEYGISMDSVDKLVEAVADKSLEIYFREKIFAPLDMKDSGFLIGSAQKKRVATLYNRRADGGLDPAPFEMPPRPEFLMGGGAFSTPRDYLIFLEAQLNGGAVEGRRILRADTVATKMQNQIGELNVHEMRSAQAAYSRSFDQFPGQPHKWGLSFDINTQPGPNGRVAGSISCAGLLNCYFWLDPVCKVTGALFTQTLPFYDDRIVALYGAFERGPYAGLA